jgi:hypothetical protein
MFDVRRSTLGNETDAGNGAADNEAGDRAGGGAATVGAGVAEGGDGGAVWAADPDALPLLLHRAVDDCALAAADGADLRRLLGAALAAHLRQLSFLITTFFRSQPAEIFEAARIDGASELEALWRIALPLAWPIMVTVAIFNFLSIYGDFIWPTLMLSQGDRTLLMALEQYMVDPETNEFGSRPDIGIQTAGYVVATIPQLIVFALGMKYFIQGVTSGAVKA